MCAMLSIFVDAAPGPAQARKGMCAVADVQPVATASGLMQPVTGLVVPLDDPDAPAITDVSAGQWLVRVRMPSGEMLSQAIRVGRDPVEVRLQGQASADDELGFEFAAGLVPSAHHYEKVLSQTVQLQKDLSMATAQILENLSLASTFSQFSLGASKGSLMPLSTLGLGAASDAARFHVDAPLFLPPAAAQPAARSHQAIDLPTETHLSTVVAELDAPRILRVLKSPTLHSLTDIAALLFGTLVDERSVPLRGQPLLKSANIDLPEDAEAMGDPTQKKGGRSRRVFAWLRAHPASDKVCIACIPRDWTVTRSGREADMRVVVSAQPTTPSRLHMKLAVHDPDVASVLGFLQTGDLDNAERLTRQSIDYLDQKFHNPYAAAASAYVLVHSRDADQSPPWQGWVNKLARQFPGIPDGAILQATLLLQRGEQGTLLEQGTRGSADWRRAFTTCRQLVLQAICGGPPVFKLGIKLLAENIDILRNLERELGEPTEELTRASELARWMLLRVDTSQSFTVFRI